MFSPTIQPTSWWPSATLPPLIPSASSTAPSSSLSAPVSMEDILARIARLEARLEAKEQRWAPAFPPSRAEAEPPFGLADWCLPSWDPGSHPSPQSWRPPLPQQAPWDSPWLCSNHEPPRPDPDLLYGMPTTWRLSTWETQSMGLYQPTVAPSDVVQPPLGFRQPSPAPQPSLADPHVPWESPWQPSQAPPSFTESVPCPVAEEAADSKGLGAIKNQDPSSVHATNGSGIGDGDANKAAQSSAADTNDDEFEKTLEFTDALMVYDSKVAKEHYSRTLEIEVDKTGELAPACESEFAFAHYKFGWALLYQAQGEADPFHFTPNKKGEGPWKKRLKSREVSRRSTIFGIYALEEVYKDFLYLHLEDKVILKGGGVDTLIN